jgi:hypothetical protein
MGLIEADEVPGQAPVPETAYGPRRRNRSGGRTPVWW